MGSLKRVVGSKAFKIGVPALIVAAAAAAVIAPLIGGAALLSLHPSGVSSAGSWVTSPTAGQWATYLDTADGQTSYAVSTSENNTCVVDMDDPGAMVGSITSVTIAASVRDFNAVQESYQLGMSDGANQIWGTAAQTPSAWTTVTFTSSTAPDGSSWDWTDVTNLKGTLAHKRYDEGSVTASQTRSPNTTGAAAGFSAVATQQPMWAQVDEYPTNNGDTDYVQGTNATGGNVHFGHSAFSVPSGATSISVHVVYVVRDITTGANNVGAMLRANSTTYTSTTNNPGNIWTTYRQVWTTNPGNGGAAWTVADVNGSSPTPLGGFGIYSTDFSPNILLTQCYCYVEYLTPTWDTDSRLGVSEMMVTVDYQPDVTPPTVSSATYVDKTHVDVSFDETYAPGSANFSYFTLDNGASVTGTSAVSAKVIRLTTSVQSEQATTYTVTVNDGAPSVTDLAGNPVVAPNNTAQFVSPDIQPPRVVSATPVDATHVDISFDETYSPGSASYTYFSIDNGISVTGTSAVSAKVIRLTTSATSQGTLYTVTVASGAPSVTDQTGNAVVAPDNDATYTGPDVTPPKVSGVTQVDSTHVDVSFDETIAAGSVNAAYFSIDNGISVSGAAYQSAKVARVTCSALSAAVFYTVTVNNGAPSVTDLAGNACVAPDNTGSFTGVDVTGPALTSAVTVDVTHVDVNFSEPVAQGSLNYTYFSVDNGLSVTATSAVDADTVRLTTSVQTPGTVYTITVPNGGATVKDLLGNPCVAPNNTTTFSGWGGEDVWVPAGINVSVNATNAGIGFTFANVTAANWLHVVGGGSPSSPPGHAPAGGYYNLTFDGTFTGNVSVSMPYDVKQIVGDESTIQCYKYSGGTWTDVTTGYNPSTSKVTGTSTSFSGWQAFSPITAGDSPHGGYSTASNKCAVCHAIHGAENAANNMNGEALLRSTRAGACDYCHVGGPFTSIYQVYQSNPAKYAADSGFEHSVGAAYTQIQDSNDTTTTNGAWDPANDYTITGGLACVSCHTVHGKNAIGGATPTNILKLNPNPSNSTSVPSGVTAANYDPWFCQDCHTSNYITAHDSTISAGGYDTSSHIMTSSVSASLVSLTATDSSRSDNCRDCHEGASNPASINAGNNYPHYTAGKYFLTDAFNQTGTVKYDAICLRCHASGTIW
ncbi:MAG: hypothetical protein FDZ70_05870 [Actinobacteria bacterium]|nr:MAG: hypothetical protein FDZ70_05870 [Actinomycetota bacterium]